MMPIRMRSFAPMDRVRSAAVRLVKLPVRAVPAASAAEVLIKSRRGNGVVMADDEWEWLMGKMRMRNRIFMSLEP